MIFLFYFQAAEAFLVRLFEDAYHSVCLFLPHLISTCCHFVLLIHVIQCMLARVQFCTNRVLAKGFSLHVATHGKVREQCMVVY